MNEEAVRHMPKFLKKGFLWQVRQGCVLVKQNNWSNNGKIRAIVKYHYSEEETEDNVLLSDLSFAELKQELKSEERTPEEIEMINREIIFRRREKLRQLSDEELTALAQSKRNLVSLINEELQYRNDRRSNNLPLEELQRDERLQGYQITLKVYKERVKKFTAKNGMLIRWPWESGIVLSLGDTEIKTPDIPVDTKDKIRLTFDTDYMYRIIDPQLFAVRINQEKSVRGVEKLMGDQLDRVVINYARTVNAEDFRGKDSNTLKTKLQSEIDKVEEYFGVKITKFILSKVTLPDYMTEAQARAAAAKAEAQQKSILADAEAANTEKIGKARASAAKVLIDEVTEILRSKGIELSGVQISQLAAIIASTSKENSMFINNGAGGSPEIGSAALGAMIADAIGRQFAQMQQQGQAQQPTQQQGQPQPTAPTAPTTPTDGDEVSNDGKAKTR